MIDRLEILSNGFIKKGFFGNDVIEKSIENSWNRNELEKLFEETDFNFIVKSEGFIYDAIYKLEFFDRPFLLFTGRHFKKQPLLKLVINPNYFELSYLQELIDIYFIQFYPARIGRIDYNIDLDMNLWNLVKGIILNNKRKTVTVREYHKKDLETMYIGAGDFMIRLYDKIKESKQKKQKTSKQILDYFNSNDLEYLTRLEFQLRGKEAGFDLQDFLDGDIDLEFLDDIDFFLLPGLDGSFRMFGLSEYIDNFGLQATYQKMNRNKRKEWLEKRFTKMNINHKLKELIYDEILKWLDGQYVYKVHSLPGN